MLRGPAALPWAHTRVRACRTTDLISYMRWPRDVRGGGDRFADQSMRQHENDSPATPGDIDAPREARQARTKAKTRGARPRVSRILILLFSQVQLSRSRRKIFFELTRAMRRYNSRFLANARPE